MTKTSCHSIGTLGGTVGQMTKSGFSLEDVQRDPHEIEPLVHSEGSSEYSSYPSPARTYDGESVGSDHFSHGTLKCTLLTHPSNHVER